MKKGEAENYENNLPAIQEMARYAIDHYNDSLNTLQLLQNEAKLYFGICLGFLTIIYSLFSLPDFQDVNNIANSQTYNWIIIVYLCFFVIISVLFITFIIKITSALSSEPIFKPIVMTYEGLEQIFLLSKNDFKKYQQLVVNYISATEKNKKIIERRAGNIKSARILLSILVFLFLLIKFLSVIVAF